MAVNSTSVMLREMNSERLKTQVKVNEALGAASGSSSASTAQASQGTVQNLAAAAQQAQQGQANVGQAQPQEQASNQPVQEKYNAPVLSLPTRARAFDAIKAMQAAAAAPGVNDTSKRMLVDLSEKIFEYQKSMVETILGGIVS